MIKHIIVISNNGYSGRSGANYQYDLSKPIDQSRYSTDIAAQKRDLMNLDLRKGLDRGMG